MKNFKLFLVIFSTIGTVFNFSLQSNAASASSLEDTQKYISKKGETQGIPGHSSYISCTFSQDWSKKDFLCINYDILTKADKRNVGKILVQYYHKGEEFPLPTIRLRDITITNESDRKKGYGSHALEALFALLRKCPLFPGNTIIKLEYTAFTKDDLKTFYEKFGFKMTSYNSGLGLGIMTVPLKDVKFPYYAAKK